GFAPRYLIGNHGAEGVPGYEHEAAGFARVCRGWLEELAADGAPWRTEPGVALEDKTCSLSLHYRHARNRRRTRQWLERRSRRPRRGGSGRGAGQRRGGRGGGRAPGPVLIAGRWVITLPPPAAPQRGGAPAAFSARGGCPPALYSGDAAPEEGFSRLPSPA